MKEGLLNKLHSKHLAGDLHSVAHGFLFEPISFLLFRTKSGNFLLDFDNFPKDLSFS